MYNYYATRIPGRQQQNAPRFPFGGKTGRCYSIRIGFQRCTGQLANDLHGLYFIDVDRTVEHVEKITVFNDPLEQGVVCQAVHNDKVGAVRHVEDEGLDIAARLRVTGRPDANAQGVYINIPLTKGPMGQTAAVREGTHTISSMWACS